MRTYYRGPDAVVTSELFVWRTTPAKIFAIRELHRVGFTSGDPERVRPYTVQAAAGSTALVIALWPVVDTPGMVAVLGLAITIPIVAVGAYWRLRPRLWTLHAVYRGAEVVLYASTNARVFNQVMRALRRAIEDLPHEESWSGAASLRPL